MIRCVVFDFDGTLVESNQIKRQVFFELASEYEEGLRVMADVMSEADGRERHWIFARFAAALPSRADAKLLVDQYTKICQERIACAPEIIGARASLKHLQAEGRLLFVNSATPVEPLTRLVRLRKMDKLFSGVYGAPAKKQDNLEYIRSKYGLTPAEILVVGDGESDRTSAKILGCYFVAVNSAENDFTVEPPCRISDLTELPEIVATIGFIGDKK